MSQKVPCAIDTLRSDSCIPQPITEARFRRNCISARCADSKFCMSRRLRAYRLMAEINYEMTKCRGIVFGTHKQPNLAKIRSEKKWLPTALHGKPQRV